MTSTSTATPASTVSPTHLTNTGVVGDAWPVCECGSTPEGGFEHSDADGTLRDDEGNPTPDWDGMHYRCPCGVVFRWRDLLIVARVERMAS